MKETVYQAIRERILYLEYPPGTILNEKELSETFGLGRSPVKNILSRLEWEQLVRVIPRTGSMVTEIEFGRIMHVYQVRFEMESFEAGLAEAGFAQRHEERLKTLLDLCRNPGAVKDRKALADIDIALREIFHDAAGNPVLEEVSDRLYFQTFRLWFSILQKGDWKEEIPALEAELDTLLAYLSSGEKDRLAAIRRDQLLSHFERLRVKFLGV